MSEPVPSPRSSHSRVWIVVHLMLALLILIPAGYGFGSKFRELVCLWEGYREKSPTERKAQLDEAIRKAHVEEEAIALASASQEGRHKRLTEDEAADGGFAMVPVLNYLLVSIGFFLLFCAAILHGMFRDIEKPKRDMLEKEWVLDEMERAAQVPTALHPPMGSHAI